MMSSFTSWSNDNRRNRHAAYRGYGHAVRVPLNGWIDCTRFEAYTEFGMSKRIAILLLALATAFAGVSVCPRGVRACSVSPGAAHKCCGQAGALQKPSCCKGAADRAPTTVTARLHTDASTGTAVLVASSVSAPALARHRTLVDTFIRGLAPPGPLLTHHTALQL